jgi:hypothetical protein
MHLKIVTSTPSTAGRDRFSSDFDKDDKFGSNENDNDETRK